MQAIDRPPSITVLGGGGFIGRYVCEALLKSGARVLVAQRDVRGAHAIQPLGQVGQVGYRLADLTNRASVAAAVKGADAVVNLVGSFRDMDKLHIEGARVVAEEARAAGVTALVHVSAIGADVESKSAYGRTKGAGEAAVRQAFPEATVIRPSLVFGPGDQLTNRFAAMGRLPLVPVLAAETRFQPIYVRDLGRAIALAALDSETHAGKTYELGGPEVMSFIDLQRAIFALAGRSPELVALPNLAGDLLSRLGFLPGAPLTRDQWLMLQNDNVVSAAMPGLAAFGIEPTPLAAVAGEWLARYRSGSRFQRRPSGPATPIGR